MKSADLTIAVYVAQKWGTIWKMTNREYLATLSNEELSNAIYDVIVDRIGRRYNSSKLGVAQWLGELYRENDFTKGFAYYADNKKIMDGGEK